MQRCDCRNGNTCTSITAGSISQFSTNIHINDLNYATNNSCFCNALSFLFLTEFAEVSQTEHINFILKIGFQGYDLLNKYYNKKGGMLYSSELDILQFRQNKNIYYKYDLPGSQHFRTADINVCENSTVLADAILNCLETNNSILINCKAYTSAVKKKNDGKFFYFDSHGNDEITGLKKTNGVAVCLTFKCAATFHEYLIKRYEHEGFENRDVFIDIEPCEFKQKRYLNRSLPIVYVDGSHGNDSMLNLPQGTNPIKEKNPITGKSPSNVEFLSYLRAQTSSRLNINFPKKTSAIFNDMQIKVPTDSGDSHQSDFIVSVI